MIGTNIIIDYLITEFQNSSFYLSESLVFSSFWLLFLPSLIVLSKITVGSNQIRFDLIIISSFVAIHLIAYPALVWLLSKVFFNHTYSYLQTFNFGLSTYLIKSIIIYAVSFFAIIITQNRTEQKLMPIVKEVKNSSFISSILVSDNYKKVVLPVDDIYYFSANSPYVNIHCSSKKYLFTATLKNLESQLDKSQFVRIHKSYILNIGKVDSYKSRKNGDYDITLSDNASLRVSRSYANAFKTKFNELHRLANK